MNLYSCCSREHATESAASFAEDSPEGICTSVAPNHQLASKNFVMNVKPFDLPALPLCHLSTDPFDADDTPQSSGLFRK